jgi:hypothetical protein
MDFVCFFDTAKVLGSSVRRLLVLGCAVSVHTFT